MTIPIALRLNLTLYDTGMKGIVLAGGTGSRLWPITRSVSKQLLPIYDKPMIYYPISVLMLAGIREILIITTPHDQSQFKDLLGNGVDIGVLFHYAVQEEPRGLAQAFTIGEDFLGGDSCLMILGDNIFHGVGLGLELQATLPKTGAHIFTYEVDDPSQYGVLTIDEDGKPTGIQEKPKTHLSSLAVTGLYFFDNSVCEVAKQVIPSPRGELEITSVIDWYLQKNLLSATHLSRGTAWLDTGSPSSLHDAASYIRIIEERTGLKIACLEEIAFRNEWIDAKQLLQLASNAGNKNYELYLTKIAKQLS